jgi:hypothetical protein
MGLLMPREFVLRIVLADEFIDDTATSEQEASEWKAGHFDINDLIGVAENSSECSVEYKVKDI